MGLWSRLKGRLGETAAPIENPVTCDVSLEQASSAGEPTEALSEAVLQFGLQVLRDAGPSRSCVLSPWSLAELFARLWGGANTETRDEIGAAFRWPTLDESALRASLKELVDLGSTLHSASALWFSERIELRDAYVETWCDGAPRRADFSRPAMVVETINAWICENTRGFLTDVVPSHGVNQDTRLIAANAVYLKAVWDNTFVEALTRDAAFHLLDGSTELVPMMRLEERLRYVATDDYEAIRKPFADGGLEMAFLLPRRGRFENVRRRVTAGSIQAALVAAESTLTDLSIPKFGLECEPDVDSVLRRLGVNAAYDRDRADFTALRENTAEPVWIDRTIHRARVDVDERGAEAAAVTLNVMLGSAYSPPKEKPVVFRVDRPFLFVIRDTTRGCPLFVGTVVNPKG
jgi:serine protease inhibitor